MNLQRRASGFAHVKTAQTASNLKLASQTGGRISAPVLCAQQQASRAPGNERLKHISKEQQAASDRTRRRLHSAVLRDEAPIQAPCPTALSTAGQARSPGGLNTVLEAYSEVPADQLLPLHGGLPHPDAFPISGLTVTLNSGHTLSIENPTLVCSNNAKNALQCFGMLGNIP